MTDWSAVGGNPAPGDPQLLRRFVSTFHGAETASQTVADRLAGIARGLGPHVWAGPAAELFAELAVVGLQRTAAEMAAKHGDAAAALSAYADAVEESQAGATRAAGEASAAASAASEATYRQQAASADAASAVTARDQAKDRIAQAQALAAAAAAAGDPVYLAQMKQYEQQMFHAFSAALSRQDAANQREAAARSAAQQAESDLAKARADARLARRVHDDAARVVVGRLHAAEPQPSKLVQIRDIVADWIVHPIGVPVSFIDLVKAAEHPNSYSKLWQNFFHNLPKDAKVREFFQYKRSPLLKDLNKLKSVERFGHNQAFKFVSKHLGPIGFVLDMTQDVPKLIGDIRKHDWESVATDGMHIGASGLKSFGGPVGYVAGVGVDVWADSIDGAHEPANRNPVTNIWKSL